MTIAQYLLLLVMLLLPASLKSQIPLDSCEMMTVRVVVETREGWSTGSGLIVGDGRFVITAAHVVDEGEVAVFSRGEREIGATVEWSSLDKDLALLRLKSRLRVPAAIYMPQRYIKKVETVYVLGFPGQADRSRESADQVKITKGIVSAIVHDENGRGLYQIDAPINPGNSGGPVFNEAGFVIGIAIEKPMTPVFRPTQRKGNPSKVDVGVERIPVAEGVGWAVQIDEIVPILNSHGIAFQQAIVKPSAPPSAMMKLWNDYPALVVGFGALFLLVIATLLMTLSSRGRTVLRDTIMRRRPAAVAIDPIFTPFVLGVAGIHAGQQFLMDGGSIVLGRDPNVSNIIIESPSVSKKHCVLSYRQSEKVFSLEDCGSTNGTFIGQGERLQPGTVALLKPGDSFYLGDSRNAFEVRTEAKR